MKFRPVLIGIISGLLIGGIISVLHRPSGRQARCEPLGEDGGRIERVVMQYMPAMGPIVAPIYMQFLSALGKDVEVVWVVGKQSDLDDLKKRLGKTWPEGRCTSVMVGKEISTWSKDRFVAAKNLGHKGFSVLCAPLRKLTANPLRTNDQEVPYRLAQDSSSFFCVRDIGADFDGGDFLATKRHLFAGSAVIDKNSPEAGSRFKSIAELTDYLSEKMSRKITWLGESSGESPPHHLGMFLTVFGDLAAVGDLRMAEKVVASHPESLAAFNVAGGIAPSEFRKDLSARLDRVSTQMQSLGYKVVRVPLLPSATPKAWMSYNNGIVEKRVGKTIFYMPTFGAKALDEAAAESFRKEIRCTVISIDCSKIWHLGGSLHCLVNVVERK